MKKLRFFILFLAVVLTFPALAKKVELPGAMLAAKNFYFERANLHHNLPYNNISLKLVKTVSNGDVALFYIFNVNTRGFIIVSADDACIPVLGYSFDNVYSGVSEPEGLTSLLKAYQEEVNLVKNGNLVAGNAISSAWAYYTS